MNRYNARTGEEVRVTERGTVIRRGTFYTNWDNLPTVLKPWQVAGILGGISEDAVRRLIKLGKMPGFRLEGDSGPYLIDRDDFMAWYENRKRGATA